jgi:hypothetical protein
MLFFIFIALFVVSILIIIHTNEMSSLHFLAGMVCAASVLALSISMVILGFNYIGLDAYNATWEKQYESLTYQLDNCLYDNDNDIGKKELMNQIQDWNTDLAYRKTIQRNFWVGIYYPNVYDDFEFINLP